MIVNSSKVSFGFALIFKRILTSRRSAPACIGSNFSSFAMSIGRERVRQIYCSDVHYLSLSPISHVTAVIIIWLVPRRSHEAPETETFENLWHVFSTRTCFPRFSIQPDRAQRFSHDLFCVLTLNNLILQIIINKSKCASKFEMKVSGRSGDVV